MAAGPGKPRIPHPGGRHAGIYKRKAERGPGGGHGGQLPSASIFPRDK